MFYPKVDSSRLEYLKDRAYPLLYLINTNDILISSKTKLYLFADNNVLQRRQNSQMSHYSYLKTNGRHHRVVHQMVPVDKYTKDGHYII